MTLCGLVVALLAPNVRAEDPIPPEDYVWPEPCWTNPNTPCSPNEPIQVFFANKACNMYSAPVSTCCQGKQYRVKCTAGGQFYNRFTYQPLPLFSCEGYACVSPFEL